MEPFSEDLKKVEKKFIPELKKNIKDKGLYLESIQNLLKELNIKFEEEEQKEESSSDDDDNEDEESDDTNESEIIDSC